MHYADARQHLILEVVAGSHAYGLATPESDMDVRGIFITPDKAHYIGLKNVEQIQGPEDDSEIYELRKFISLATQCNPNILEILFFPQNPVLVRFVSEQGKKLIANAGLFPSKLAYHRFSGYAYAQLKRVQRHRKWLELAPEKPTPQQYGAVWDTDTGAWIFDDAKLRRMLYDLSLAPSRISENSDQVFQIIQSLKQSRKSEYEKALDDYKSYCTWLVNRNPARAELEAKYQYDVKHCSHLARLFEEGLELLKTGNITFPHTWQYAKDIREGKYTYEEILAMAAEFDEKMRKAYDESPLPYSPRKKEIEALLMDMIEEYVWNQGGNDGSHSKSVRSTGDARGSSYLDLRAWA